MAQSINRLIEYPFLLPLLVDYLSDSDVICGLWLTSRLMTARLVDYRVKRSIDQSVISKLVERSINQSFIRRPNLFFTCIDEVNDLSPINQSVNQFAHKSPYSRIFELRFSNNYDSEITNQSTNHNYDSEIANQSINRYSLDSLSSQSTNQSNDQSIPLSVRRVTFGSKFMNGGCPFDLVRLRHVRSIQMGTSFDQPIISSINQSINGSNQSINGSNQSINDSNQSINDSIDYKDEMHDSSLQSIVFPYFGRFNQRFTWLPSSLTELDLGGAWNNGGFSINQSVNQSLESSHQSFTSASLLTSNQSINQFTFPPNLRKLKLGEAWTNCHQSSNQSIFPASLIDLDLGGLFDQVLLSDSLPPNLKRLTMSHQFTNGGEDLINQSLPQSLTDLIFGYAFDRQLIEGYLPSSLKNIKFGSSFDNGGFPLRSGDLPSRVEKIEFGEHFRNAHSPLAVDVLPESVKVIRFGSNFTNANRPFAADVLPRSLRCLRMQGRGYPMTLGDLCQVEYLRLDGDWMLRPGYVPNAVTRLTFSSTFSNVGQPLLVDSLPNTITELTFATLRVRLIDGFIPASVNWLWIQRVQYPSSYTDLGIIPATISAFALTNFSTGALAAPLRPGDINDLVTHLSFHNMFNNGDQPLAPGVIPDKVSELTFGAGFDNGDEPFAQGVLPSSVKFVTLYSRFLCQHPIETHCFPVGCVVRQVSGVEEPFGSDERGWENARPPFCTWPV